jgi:hypothetical protein
MGLKALLWLAPLDFFAGSRVLDQPELLCGNGLKGPYGNVLLDYSNPTVQETHVRPMLRYLFSSDSDCLDADGFKSDFMADKIHPQFPVHDPSWRGEEPFIRNTIALFHQEMLAHKPDAMHLGGVCHPFFTHIQDAIRTYDVPASQLQHEDRAIMLRHFDPGNLISLDLAESRSLADIEQHIDIAYRNNLLYELPRIVPDPATGEHSLGPDFMPLLRRKLLAWG